MFDLVSLGTVLIDFTPVRNNNSNKKILIQNVGGAAANITIAVSRLGMSSAFIGKAGDDCFGHFSKAELEKENVDVSNFLFDPKHQTALSFIDPSQKRVEKYTFYRHDSADIYLKEREVNKKLIDNCKAFHFCSPSLIHEPSCEATVSAVKYARQQGKIITYDPNYRPSLWKNSAEAFEKLNFLVKYCDIIKFSDDEFRFMTNSDNLIRGIANLLKTGVKIILISQGANGCIIASRKGIHQIPAHDTEIIDTTGSGDAFFAAFIYKLLSEGKKIEEYSDNELCEFSEFANAAGALCAKDFGAVASMADAESIDKFLAEYKK